MKEYSLLVQSPFQKGLRPNEHMPKNSPFLQECTFLKPTERGLRSVEGFTSVLGDETYEWPWPQLFRSDRGTYLFGETSLKVVDESAWSVGSAVSTYKLEDDTTTRDIASGGVWQFASLGDSWVACNGECVVVSDNRYVAYGNTHKYLTIASAFQAVGAHKGRIIYGGFDESYSWPAHWGTYRGILSGETSMDYSNFDPQENWVFWTPVNSDLALFWEAPADMSRLVRSNRFGFSPMPWKGTVYAIKTLGDSVVVYGDNGIAVMRHVTEPIPTFSIRKISSVGIMNRGAVGGSDDVHFFVSATGALYRLTEERGLERFGYEEYLEDLVSGEVVITYDSRKGECFIAGDYAGTHLSYVFGEGGLGTSPYRFYSLLEVDGAPVVTSDIESGTTTYVVTDWLDFGYKDFKTITMVEVGIDTSQKVWVALDYSNDDGRSYTRSSWVPLNTQGWARLQRSGTLVRIALKVASYVDCFLDSMVIHWQPSGRRTVRGPSADTVKL